jgi:hypothetical protein
LNKFPGQKYNTWFILSVDKQCKYALIFQFPKRTFFLLYAADWRHLKTKKFYIKLSKFCIKSSKIQSWKNIDTVYIGIVFPVSVFFFFKYCNSLGIKKYLWFRFPIDPIFFWRPYYFFNAIDRATLFSPGGCGLLPKWRLLSH